VGWTNIRFVAGSNVAQHIYFLQLVYDFHAFFGLVFLVAYLECVKGGGPGGHTIVAYCRPTD